MRSIEQQIEALQKELHNVRRDLAARDAQVRAAQRDAAAARKQATTAAMQPEPTPAPPILVRQPPPLPPVLGAPPGAKVLPVTTTGFGKIQIGGVTITLGGFAALEGISRSRNQGGTIDTNFNGNIPLPNSPNYRTPEFRESAQQSRFSLLVEGKPDDADKLTSYLETDFLSAGTSSNSNQSNSYTLRLRQFFGEWDNTDLGLHVEGGQGWSLATMNTVGMLPRHEQVPLTIDAQYVVGFDWARQAELRVVKDFANNKVSAGLAIEEPQTIFGSAGGPNCLTGAASTTGVGGQSLEYAQCGGPNVNTVQAYSDNIAPDVIAKLSADPGFGHYEVYGLLRFLGGRVSGVGTGHNYETTGEGIGAGMILPLVPKLVDFQVSGLYGRGVGRYGTAQIADVTFNPIGKIEPLTEYSVMGGVVAHPTPALDVYAYGGAEGVQSKAFTSGTYVGGYGNPASNLAGCYTELGSCSAVTSGVVEGTVGGWWRVLQGNYGTVQVGAQYEYIARNTFRGVGATKGSVVSPSSNENAFLFSLRYYPFQ